MNRKVFKFVILLLNLVGLNSAENGDIIMGRTNIYIIVLVYAVMSSACQCTDASQNLETPWINLGNRHLADGLEDLSKEKLVTAANNYESAIRFNSSSVDLWIAKSFSLFAAKEFSDAEVSIDQAIDLETNYAPSWMLKALILFGEDRLNESLVSINRAIELNSSEAAFWVTKGLILSEMNRYEDSFDCFDNATHINPSFAPGWLLKGMCYDILEQYDDALICYNTAISSDPLYAPAWFYKGNMLASLKRYDEAKECWTNAIEINPRYDVLAPEMEIFPNTTETSLVIQSIYVDPVTRDILDNLVFMDQQYIYKCITCDVTGMTECDKVAVYQNGGVVGKDIFADIKKQIDDSPNSLGVVPDFTTKILFHNCYTVCAATSCSSIGNDMLSCSSCTSINVDIAIYVNNDVIVGLWIRF